MPDTIGPPVILDRKPRGAQRYKYVNLGGLSIFSVFVLLSNEGEGLNPLYMVLYCAAAIALAGFECRQMWTMRARRMRRWVAVSVMLAGSSALVGVFILNDMKVLDFHPLYIWLPGVCFFLITT
ncbi:MAG: hypothetical protein WBM28_03010, partial [Burkholderiales bacterium]